MGISMKRILKSMSVLLIAMLIVTCVFAVSASAENVTLSTPQVLNISCASATSNTVYWSYVENATGYRIYRKQVGSASCWTGLANVNSGTYRYTDKTAKSGTMYYYTVKAFNQSGKTTVWSGYVTGCSTLATPTVSNTVTATDTTIKWNKISDATSYKIYRRAVGASWSALTIVDATTTSYVDSSANGKSYYYTVRAMRDSGEITAYSWYTGGVYSMLTPTVLNVNTTAATSQKIYWSKVPDCTGYRIYRKGNNDSGWTGLANVSSSAASYTDTKAKANTQYTYTVRAYKTINGTTYWGGYTSGMKSLGIPKITTTVIDPDKSNGAMRIYFSKVNNATSYKLYWKHSATDPWNVYAVISANEDYFLYTSSEYSVKFTVRAIRNNSGVDAYSWYTSGSSPTRPTVTAVDSISKATHKISWKSVPNAISYRVYEGKQYPYSICDNVPASTTSYTYNSLSSSGYYSVSAKIKTAYGEFYTPLSESFGSLQTPDHIYFPQYSSNGTFTGNTVYWKKTTDACTSYRVYRCVDGGSWTAIANVAPNKTQYTDKKADKNTYYHYTVRSVRTVDGVESKGWYYNRVFNPDSICSSADYYFKENGFTVDKSLSLNSTNVTIQYIVYTDWATDDEHVKMYLESAIEDFRYYKESQNIRPSKVRININYIQSDNMKEYIFAIITPKGQ